MKLGSASLTVGGGASGKHGSRQWFTGLQCCLTKLVTRQVLYSHVSSDLEKGITPIHVRVESEITKGKYHDYDTFLGGEAVQALKEYLHARRKGLLDSKIPNEEITDESPLIRDQSFHQAKAISEKQVRKIVHELYVKVGLIRKANQVPPLKNS